MFSKHPVLLFVVGILILIIGLSFGFLYAGINTEELVVVSEASEYIYDEEGKLLEERTTSPEQPVVISEYAYDAEGNRVKTTRSVAGRGILDIVSFMFNTNNKVVRETTTDGQNNILEEIVYAYDDADNIIKTTATDKEGNVFQINTYEYTEQNRLLREIRTRMYPAN